MNYFIVVIAKAKGPYPIVVKIATADNPVGAEQTFQDLNKEYWEDDFVVRLHTEI